MAKKIQELDLIAFQNGDEVAFKAVVDWYAEPLLVSCRKWTKNIEDAKDILQEAFYRLWKSRKKIKNLDHLHNLLFLTARNLIINEWDRLSRRGGLPIPIEKIDQDFLSSESDPYWDNRKRDVFETLLIQTLRSMASDESLSEQRRKVLYFYWHENRSVKEIAAMLGIDVQTVYTHLKRSREAAVGYLKDRLKGFLFLFVCILINYF